MIITFQGEQFFKVQAGDTVLAFNPITASKGSKVSKFGADIVFSTNQNDDRYNGFDMTSYGDKEPLQIYGAGSYESDGLMIQGYETKPDESGQIHTVYALTFDDIKIAFLGGVGSKAHMPPEALEDMTDSYLVFVDVAGSDGYSLAASLAPRAIVAMGYQSEKESAVVDFMKDAGKDNVEVVEKMTLKRKDLETLNGHVYVFKT